MLSAMAPHGREMSQDLRKKIISLHKKGEGYKKISKALLISQNTVAKVVQTFKKDGTAIISQRRPGRPRKLTPRQERLLMRRVEENRHASSLQLSKEVESQTGVTFTSWFLCSLRYCLKCYFSKGVYSFTLDTVFVLENKTKNWVRNSLQWKDEEKERTQQYHEVRNSLEWVKEKYCSLHGNADLPKRGFLPNLSFKPLIKVCVRMCLWERAPQQCIPPPAPHNAIYCRWSHTKWKPCLNKNWD